MREDMRSRARLQDRVPADEQIKERRLPVRAQQQRQRAVTHQVIQAYFRPNSTGSGIRVRLASIGAT